MGCWEGELGKKRMVFCCDKININILLLKNCCESVMNLYEIGQYQ